MLNWIGMVQSINDGYGKQMRTYRAGLKQIIEQRNPYELYKFYESFANYQQQVASGVEDT